MSVPIAVVDLGTHSCLLLVGRSGVAGELDVLEDRCEIPRFGQGLDATGRISELALERVEATLAGYVARAQELGCERLVVGGTAALRRAANQAEVVERLRALAPERGLDLEVEVIGEAREARLGWSAAARGNPATCVLDVGGGSTEVVADGGSTLVSAPVGALVLSERCAGAGWPALLDAARSGVACLGAEPRVKDSAQAPWVALGGTASNLASLELGLPAFDHLVVEGARMQASAAARWGQALAELPIEQRSRLPIEAPRAAVLPAGLACMAAALERFGPKEFTVSGRGLRYGFLAEMLRIR